VVDGTRSPFYLDGNLDAGLANAWASIAIDGALACSWGSS
jgi:hypothetical protein